MVCGNEDEDDVGDGDVGDRAVVLGGGEEPSLGQHRQVLTRQIARKAQPVGGVAGPGPLGPTATRRTYTRIRVDGPVALKTALQAARPVRAQQFNIS